ncbi:neugrin [Erinaceus europaeus]|uniref:Neugrin n=1 Tax=Erinaceus europaeus TaxID=9365 RepID=A0ABM3WFT7_ERIEU|nr:neugrin [Erinaceus europaeus]
MVSVLSRSLGARVRGAVARCGLATRGAAGAGCGGREPDPDSDWEPEERELQELESALRRRRKAARFQKIQRQMQAPGAPPRTLTREAMEQIRHLHKEFVETWSVPRLAEGFDVSTDVIRRVLKSKFVPTLEQKLKQDQKVLKKAGLAHCFSQSQGPVDSSKPLSAGHPVPGPLLITGSELASQDQGPTSALKVMESNTPSTSTRRRKRRDEGIQALEGGGCAHGTAAPGHQRLQQRRSVDTYISHRETGSGGWLGAKLKESKTEDPGDQNFSSKVVQRGREFFDDNGNFLYRI